MVVLFSTGIYSIWYNAFCFGGNSPFNSPIQAPPLDAGLSHQWTRQMLLHLAPSVIMSSLTLLTRLPLRHITLSCASHITSSSLTSQHSEKYDMDRAQGVLWVLGGPQGLTEHVASQWVHGQCAKAGLLYVHDYSIRALRLGMIVEDVWMCRQMGWHKFLHENSVLRR